MSHGCMNEEWIGECLPQVEHINGNLCHMNLVTFSEVMIATVNLSKWLLQLKIYVNKQYKFSYNCWRFFHKRVACIKVDIYVVLPANNAEKKHCIMNANIIKATFQLPQVYQILTILLMPLGFFCSQICFLLVSKLLTLRLPDGDYSWNVSCAPNLIFTFH